jgi:hypothetical protein
MRSGPMEYKQAETIVVFPGVVVKRCIDGRNTSISDIGTPLWDYGARGGSGPAGTYIR